MRTDNWLTIVGMTEDGPEGLAPATRQLIEDAEIIMGTPRLLACLGPVSAEVVDWPAPFRDGIPKLLSFKGRRVVALASGDPFWFGAGRVLAERLERDEWRAIPGPSVFSLTAAHVGWGLEHVLCRGLHNSPFQRLRPDLAPGVRMIVTLRDGPAVGGLAAWLSDVGFGPTRMHVFEALGGPRERARSTVAETFDLPDVAHPVTVALEVDGPGPVIGAASGLDDALFDHDGQITKRPVRALTLSALAPCPGERLWDIGAGSGSVGIEWLLSTRTMQAVSIEARPERAACIRTNAERMGVDNRLQVVEGSAPDVLVGLPIPDAVFVGGGLNAKLLAWLEGNLEPGTRLVANAVTLETEALLVEASARLGGDLLKVELSEPAPLGRYRGWSASYPVVQWRVVL